MQNNYFNYTDHHYEFLNYLLSFAMEQHKDEDPLLSECAKELIRYIMGMNEEDYIVVTGYDGDVIVNGDKYIQFYNGFLFFPRWQWKGNFKKWYFVCYEPWSFSPISDGGDFEGLNIIYLTKKKLKEICGKYPNTKGW